MPKLQRFNEPKFRERYLTVEEFERFTQYLSQEYVKNLCVMAFNTGMRLGEIFALK